CGAMAAFVPAAVGRRAVEHAVNDKERNRRPGPPKIIAERPRHDERRKPDERIANCGAVLAAHELFQLGARDRRRVPFYRLESCCDRLSGLRTEKTVIARDSRR